MRAWIRRSCLGSLAAALLACTATGCGGPDASATPTVATPTNVVETPPQVDAARRSLATYAGFPAREFVFARDVFPAADQPPSVDARRASWLTDASEVFGVLVGDEARAYPIRLLALHHIVNDVIDGKPVAVTYCVVCSSAVAYDPTLDGEVLAFGLDGAWRGVATLYDRASKSIWLQLTGTCIEGRHAGRKLARLPSGRHTTWADWRRLYPDTTVMAPVPEVARARPGMGYLSDAQARSGGAGWPSVMRSTLVPLDARLPENALLYGIQAEGKARGYTLAQLARERVVRDVVGGEAVVVFFDASSRSVAAFHPYAGGRALTFRWTPAAGFRDDETGSTWSMEGRCARGALAGAQLRPADGRLTEWYGWVAHHPETTLWAPALAGLAPTATLR